MTSARHAADVRLSIADQAAEAMRCAATLSRDGLETGGILLGRDLDERGVIEVVVAGGPGPRALRERTRFSRDFDHSDRLAQLWYDRDGLQWVGDWHTHPHGPAGPSTVDLGSAAQLLADFELGFEAVVTVIVTPGMGGGWRRPRLHPYAFAR